jgi:hypothetical protein
MFDPNEGDTHIVVVDYKLTGDSGKITFKQKKATIRKFQGECVEELLYTIDNFRDTIQDTGLAPDELHTEFGKILGHGPRKRWKALPKISTFAYSKDTAGLSEALRDFIKSYVKDVRAKDTMLSSLEHGLFKKPMEKSVVEHLNRCEMLFDYIDLLPGDRTMKLTDKERKLYFFKTFPNAWKEAFIKTAKDLYSCDLDDMKEFMMRQKTSSDSEEQKRKKLEEKKKKKSNDNPNSKDNNSNRRNKSNYRKQENNGNGKFQSKQISDDKPCPIHPGTKHTWGQCNMNPKSRRQTGPYDPNKNQYNRNGTSQPPQGRDGYYQQNPAYSPRQHNNNNDGYSNYRSPPAQVSFGSQASAGSQLPPPPQHWNQNQW